jgi:hypothetical protein
MPASAAKPQFALLSLFGLCKSRFHAMARFVLLTFIGGTSCGRASARSFRHEVLS